MNTKIYADFQICISVPLSINLFLRIYISAWLLEGWNRAISMFVYFLSPSSPFSLVPILLTFSSPIFFVDETIWYALVRVKQKLGIQMSSYTFDIKNKRIASNSV